MRTAYRCRAYPTPEQETVLNRIFGCVRVVWNRTLAARHNRWHTERKSTSYAETDRALTEMKKLPELAWLNEVSSVPLQQTLRHQHSAMTAFFAKRARYPRYKWSATGAWPRPSPGLAGPSSGPCWPTRRTATAGPWP